MPPGRKPKPTHLKLLEGNPGKRPLNQHEPKLTQKIPTCPGWLLPEAKLEWRRVVKELADTGIITIVDRSMLAAYCQMWARFVEAEKSGQPLPASKVAQMRALASEFGIGASSRSRFNVEKQEEKDLFEEFLRGSNTG